jgi:hypothetical protein
MAFERDMTLHKYNLPGCVVFDETKKFNPPEQNPGSYQYVAIVLEGEFELSKVKLDEVFLNTNTGQIKINTVPEGKPIKSSAILA